MGEGSDFFFVVIDMLMRAAGAQKLIPANANINILVHIYSTDMEMYRVISFSTKHCCKLGLVSNGMIMLAVIANY